MPRVIAAAPDDRFNHQHFYASPCLAGDNAEKMQSRQ
jgi:hypothetical protein